MQSAGQRLEDVVRDARKTASLGNLWRIVSRTMSRLRIAAIVDSGMVAMDGGADGVDLNKGSALPCRSPQRAKIGSVGRVAVYLCLNNLSSSTTYSRCISVRQDHNNFVPTGNQSIDTAVIEAAHVS